MDSVIDPSPVSRLEQHAASRGLPFARVSAVTGEGIDGLLEAMWKHLSGGAGGNSITREAVARSAGAH
jgi:hypothetical protein